jgi:hypothetical protein
MDRNWVKGLILIWAMGTFCSMYAQETIISYLSGTGCDNTVDWDFYCTQGRNSGKWTTIPVPSNWELQGFGTYNYGYDKSDDRADEEGLYRHNFTIPSQWEGKKINIVFEGSMTDTEVKINGVVAGEIHQGAFYRFRYDISKLVRYGKENLLEVRVAKVSSNESVNKAERNADYWIFGGIYRPVYLEVLPAVHVEQCMIDADANGEFKAILHLVNNDKKDKLRIRLKTLNGKEIGDVKEIETGGESLVEINAFYNEVLQWTPEKPNLYEIEISILRKDKTLHVITERIGFRTIEVRKKDGVYLNGVKIKFKGVNRHSFYPATGRTLSKRLILEDVLLIKEMNMNSIRNSHYPADAWFYDVCDSLGIMVLDELGGWHDAYDTEVGSKLVKEMMYKSMNHPCVVFWVNGNEGGHNKELLPLYDSIDIQQRHVIHAWELFRGMDTQHYRDYNYGIGSHYQGHEVVLPTEFLHGMYDGGHGAGLEDFWELMWHNPLSAGGLLWDFADEAVVRTDKNGILDSDGNHGADGIVGPYHEKEGSFYAIKEIWSPVKFEHKEITKDFDGALVVENRFHFTNLNECSFYYNMVKGSRSGQIMDDGEETFNIASPDVEPGEKGMLILKDIENIGDYDFLKVWVNDPYGKKLFTWTWPVKLPVDVAQELVVKELNSRIEIKHLDSIFSVCANGIIYSFNKSTGLLNGVKNNNTSISLNNGPILCEGNTVFKQLKVNEFTDSVIVYSVFEEKSVFQKSQWTIYASGWAKLYVEYSPVVERHDNIGISFNYPEELVEGVEWMGTGPYRVWKNRMKGMSLGVWQKDYNNTITGQTEYIYPEFKGYHANMYWLKIQNKESDFLIVTPNRDLFFRLYTPGTPNDPYNTAPEFPDGDISFMHGVQPMGTKCLQTFRMGPMSERNIYYSFGGDRPLKMTLYFNFSAENSK